MNLSSPALPNTHDFDDLLEWVVSTLDKHLS